MCGFIRRCFSPAQISDLASLPPSPPTGLSASAFGNGIVPSLMWNTVSGAISYKLKRGTASGGPYSVTTWPIFATNYLDQGLLNDTAY